MKGINYLSNKTSINESAILEPPVRTYGYVQIKKESAIGRFTFLNNDSTVFDNVKIGRYCSIGKNCQLGVFDHPIDWLSTSPVSYNMKLHFPDYDGQLIKAKIKRAEGLTIGNDVWIGSNTIIKRGITIGDGAVISGGAFVSRDVAPYAIVGGSPAKLIRFRFDHKTILALLGLKWWDMPIEAIEAIDFSNIQQAIKQLNKITNKSQIQKK